MDNINVAVLSGRLVKDAEVSYTGGGLPVGKFDIAVNRRKKQGDEWVNEANFFTVVSFGKMAETLKPMLIKGKEVCVHANLRQERWTAPNGENRSKVSMVAESIQIFGNQKHEESCEMEPEW